MNPHPPLLQPPDLFKYRLVNSRLINSTFVHNKEGCLLSDVSDENNAYMVYFVSFLGTLAVLPGNIVSALLMDKIGRLRMLGKGRPARGSSAGAEGNERFHAAPLGSAKVVFVVSLKVLRRPGHAEVDVVS